LEDRIAVDDDIINFALKDKSFEVRVWLVNAIKNLDEAEGIMLSGNFFRINQRK